MMTYRTSGAFSNFKRLSVPRSDHLLQNGPFMFFQLEKSLPDRQPLL